MYKIRQMTAVSEKSFSVKSIDLSQSEVMSSIPTLLGFSSVFEYDGDDNIWETHAELLAPLKNEISIYLKQYAAEHSVSLNVGEPYWDGWFVSTSVSNTHLLKHSHKGHADICFLFYLFVEPGASHPGHLEIYQSDTEVNEESNHFIAIKPRSGLLVMFPGSSPHRVQPYTCARFAIATNVKFE